MCMVVEMARQTTDDGETKMVSLRLPIAFLERLDSLYPNLPQAMPRGALIKAAVREFLEREEAKTAKPSKVGKRPK